MSKRHWHFIERGEQPFTPKEVLTGRFITIVPALEVFLNTSIKGSGNYVKAFAFNSKHENACLRGAEKPSGEWSAHLPEKQEQKDKNLL